MRHVNHWPWRKRVTIPFRMTLPASLLVLALASPAAAFESGRITVTATGSGPAVLLIPGVKSSPGVWDDLLPSLSGHEVHLVQVNGFAGTPPGDNATGELLPALAAEIARYIEEEELADVAVIGHSMGGTVVALLAARHPRAIDRLMIIDIPAWFGEIMGIPPEQVASAAAGMRSQSLSQSPAERQAADRGFATAAVLDASAREAVLADMLASDPVVAAQAQYEVMVTDLRPLLPAIEAPTTVVFVTPAQMPSMSEQAITGFYATQYQGVRDLHLEFVPDSGHFVMLDQPARLGEIVEAFLD